MVLVKKTEESYENPNSQSCASNRFGSQFCADFKLSECGLARARPFHSEVFLKSLKIHHVLLALDALFEGGRMSVGAISAAYLSFIGLGLADIAMIKSAQAGVFLIFEYPTGLFADLVGRPLSLTFSLLFAAVGFLLYAFGADLPQFIVAEILTALSLCFWSGAFESFAIDRAKLKREDSSLDRFFHLDYSLKQGGVMVFGALGGLIGAWNFGGAYYLASTAMLFAFLVLLVIERRQTQNFLLTREALRQIRGKSVQHIKASFKAGLANRRILPFTIVLMLMQAVIQPLLHFWQILLLKSPGVGPKELGFVFSLSCLTGILSCGFLAKISNLPFVRTPKMTSILFAIFGICYFFTGYLSSWPLVAIFFCLTQGMLSVAKSSLAARLNEVVPQHVRASVLSLNTTISRLGMIASLSIIGLFLKSVPGASEGQLFCLFGAFVVFCASAVGFALFLNRLSYEEAVA